MRLPRARKDDLLATQLEDEVVVYDPERKEAHSLNRTAVAVWKNSDGQTSLAELRQRVSAEMGAPVSEATIWLALRELERVHLLADKLGATDPVTRRQMLSKAGRVGAAAMLATPIVLSTAVPAAAITCSVCGVLVATNTNCQCQQNTEGHGSCVNPLATTTACTSTTGLLGCQTLLGLNFVCVAADGKCHAVCPLTNSCTC